MPRLVVMMPAYNAERTIDGAVRSTLRALPDDAVLAVRDDGSMDGTVARLEKLAEADPRLLWTASGRNEGIVAALRWLVATTDSQWIARMDSDDICLPWRFKVGFRHVHGLKLDASFTGLMHTDKRLRRIRPSAPLPLSPEALPYDLILDNSLPNGGVLVCREAVQKVGGYRAVASEDYDLWLRMVLDGRRMARTAMPGYLYRSHPGQITANSEWQERAHTSRLTAQSHDQLMQRLTGAEQSIFLSLRVPHPSAQDRSRVSVALELLEKAIEADAALHPFDKMLLRRRLRAVHRRRGNQQVNG